VSPSYTESPPPKPDLPYFGTSKIELSKVRSNRPLEYLTRTPSSGSPVPLATMALANMDVGAMEFSMGVADQPTKMDVSLDDLIKQVNPESARTTTPCTFGGLFCTGHSAQRRCRDERAVNRCGSRTFGSVHAPPVRESTRFLYHLAPCHMFSITAILPPVFRLVTPRSGS